MKKTVFITLISLMLMGSGNIFSQEYIWYMEPETYTLESYNPQSAIYFDISSMLVDGDVPEELEYIDVDLTQSEIQSYRAMQLEGTFYALDGHIIKFVPYNPWSWTIPDYLWITAYDENWQKAYNDGKMTFIIDSPE